MTKTIDPSLSRRRFIKVAAGSLATFSTFNILRGQSSVPQGVNLPVKVGYLPITDSAPLLIAHARGLYKDEGLTAEQPALFRSWAQIVEAFVAGQVNVVHLLSPITLTLRYGRGFPAKVIAWNHTNGSALTIRPDFAGPHDLAGQTVAVPSWYSIHNVVVQEILRQEGLKYSLKADGPVDAGTVKLVTLPPSDMISAIANKSIGGFIVAEPFNAAAELKGIGKIARFTGDVWENHACCVVLVREDAISGNREWTRGGTDPLARKWLGLHPAPPGRHRPGGHRARHRGVRQIRGHPSSRMARPAHWFPAFPLLLVHRGAGTPRPGNCSGRRPWVS